ncbi:hypothetical protein [Halobaculum magnesiiphilum]|uniref:Uncharacterized protein n=1 Tax=Halobaculum magnesiiphilum TaxID=1017351 RepID=A0A8T8WF75_9EURY|nr:hypothetical protein [Halobaculum magnesiiphilum]QZP38542.1 hypothetical protein K6T50_05215 [Halobaculum magnesiiphilum]
MAGSDFGRVRYVRWAEQEKPPASSPNAEGDRVFTSRDSRRHKRSKAVTGPSGHQYRFRGALGQTSQWLPLKSIEDLDAFEAEPEYEVERA